MSRGTQNTLLLLVGLSAVVMVIKGTYLHFVKPSLLPWLIAAAVVLIALAVASIVRDLRHAPAEDHGHRHRPWLVWLLLVPIALTTFVVPPPLGAHGAAPEAVAATEPATTCVSAAARRPRAHGVDSRRGHAGGRRFHQQP